VEFIETYGAIIVSDLVDPWIQEATYEYFMAKKQVLIERQEQQAAAKKGK